MHDVRYSSAFMFPFYMGKGKSIWVGAKDTRVKLMKRVV
jgi:hypothetical protein